MFENYKIKSTRHLAWAMIAYSSISIFGPLAVFGVIGYFLDKFFNTGHIILFISIAISFIVTNILLFIKVSALSRWAKEQGEERRDK